MQTMDTLLEFHLHSPDHEIHAHIAHLITALKDREILGLEQSWQKIHDILGESEANKILHFMCKTMHVNSRAFIKDHHVHKISPKLLLHVALFPLPFVAQKLQIDQDWAAELLEELHKQFIIDDPIRWLEGFLTSLRETSHQAEKQKHSVLLGHDVASTPQDTAEYRKLKNRYKDNKSV